MLLVAAHTTVFPFFEASPTGELTLSALRKAELTLLTFVVARDRLQRSLLQLSLALMDKLPEARGRRSETQDARINKPEVHDLPRSTAARGLFVVFCGVQATYVAHPSLYTIYI